MKSISVTHSLFVTVYEQDCLVRERQERPRPFVRCCRPGCHFLPRARLTVRSLTAMCFSCSKFRTRVFTVTSAEMPSGYFSAIQLLTASRFVWLYGRRDLEIFALLSSTGS